MLQRLIDDMGNLILLAAISFLVGIMKMIGTKEPQNWKARIGTLIISVFVGTLAGALTMQYQLGDYTALTITSLASLLSRDIVMGILNNRVYIGRLVKIGLRKLVNKYTS